MRAALIFGDYHVRCEERPDPEILAPGDAVVRVNAASVCGSDLLTYWGVRHVTEPTPFGHELVGVVEQVGSDVCAIRPGDFVICPFTFSCGECQACRHGATVDCDRRAKFAALDADGLPVGGAQAEAVRIPMADSTLVAIPELRGETLPRDVLANLVTLADVMCTGHHAALSAGAAPGQTVVVVGDGAVGLLAVLAAHRLGAERIIAMSSHPDRAELARDFGATDIVAQRGADGVAAVCDVLGGDRADCAIDAVGTAQAVDQAIDSTRGGGRVAVVGVPAGRSRLNIETLFYRDITITGGQTPARTYIPDLVPDVLSGHIAPGRVFSADFPLARIADAYAAMDQRRAIKSLVLP